MLNKRILSTLLALLMILSAMSAMFGVSFASDPKYTPGDIDGNGQILANDARTALRVSAKLETNLTREQLLAADVDRNGQVLANDARQILRYSAKLLQEFETVAPPPADDETTTVKKDETTQKQEDQTTPQKTVRTMEQPTFVKTQVEEEYYTIDQTTGKRETHTRMLDQFTFTFKTVPQNLEELKQFDMSDPVSGGALATCLTILLYDCYVPQDKELYTYPSSNESLEETYEMLKYMCEYNPDSNASTTYHSKLGWNETRTFIHEQLSRNNNYKYTLNSYKNGATIYNGYTPDQPISITVRESRDTSGETTPGYPTLTRYKFDSSGADTERFIDMFYSSKNKRWYVFSSTWKYMLQQVRDPIVQWIAEYPDVPAGNKMEQPTYTKSEKVLKDFTYIDGNTNERKTEDVPLKQYTFTFKTLPTTLGELMQFDISDPEVGGYLMTCLSILIFDIYEPMDGELTSNPSKNAKLEEVYEMLKYLAEYDPDSNAATNYHNRLDPTPTKQFIHQQLAYSDRYKYTINSYKNGATPENEYTPTLPVSITVTEYVYDLGDATPGHLKRHRFTFKSSGADGERFIDGFYDPANRRWFSRDVTWKFLLTSVRDPAPTEW